MFRPAAPATGADGRDSRPTHSSQDLAALGDGELVQSYLATRDAQAFAQIASRYGGMVYRTCLRLVHHAHDAEDATQAVFLQLARKPHKAQASLAGWLYKVAHDTAITVLRSRARRQQREETAAMHKAATTPRADDELRRELDNAIGRLPNKLREAVILCHLEGQRQEEAARRLGCNQGTLSRWAADGLSRLRATLLRRGVAVSSVALAAFLAEQPATAAMPATLLSSLKLTGAGVAGVSVKAVALADATARAAAVVQAKIAAGVVLAASVVVGGATLAFRTDEPPRVAAAFVSFDGPTLPVNKAGEGYPKPSFEPGTSDPGGNFTMSLVNEDAVSGQCLRMRLTEGRLKAHFTPEGKLGRKTFARDYVADPSAWRFNTYNRLRFWVKLSAAAPPHSTTGNSNMSIGTYVKHSGAAGTGTLDDSGGSYFHRLNVPAVDCWAQVLVNMHPHVGNRATGEHDIGNQPHPTGEEQFNYFDTLSQFYIEGRQAPARFPVDYYLDEMEFYQEARPENDDQIYSIVATHVPAQNRLLLTWSHRIGEDTLAHEVRYSFTDIHTTGWAKAQPAPGGLVRPAGKGIANGMVYDTRDLPLTGQRLVYLAIKPQSSDRFSQIAVPLTFK